MTTHTLFPTSGTTKGFTAASMAMVIDDPQKVLGQSPVQWNTPIATRLPAQFVLSDEHATTVTTVEDALSHRTGLPILPNLQLAEALRDPALGIADLIRLLRHVPLVSDPAHRRFEYSNESYQVISYLLHRLTGERLGDLLRKDIWRPLSMSSTFFSVDSVRYSLRYSSQLAQGYTWHERSQQYIAEDYGYCAATSGAGAIVSSASDYAKWLHCLLFERMPLSLAVHRAIKFPRISVGRGAGFDHFLTPEQPYHSYTIGWFLDRYRGVPLYWHAGSQLGAAVIVGFLPSIKFGFTIMANTQSVQYAQMVLCGFLLDQRLDVPDPGHMMIQIVAKSLTEVGQEAPNHCAHVQHRSAPFAALGQICGHVRASRVRADHSRGPQRRSHVGPEGSHLPDCHTVVTPLGGVLYRGTVDAGRSMGKL